MFKNNKLRLYKSPNYNGDMFFVISEDLSKNVLKYETSIYFNNCKSAFFIKVNPFSKFKLYMDIKRFIKKFHKREQENFEKMFIKKCDEALANIIKSSVSNNDLEMLIRNVHKKVSELTNIPIETVTEKVLEIYYKEFENEESKM